MIGIDTVKIERITKLKKRFGNKALTKFLHEDEISLIKSDSSLAGFWAAKEAISKALGLGISANCGFHDIKIYKDENGAPSFSLSKRLIDTFCITDLSLSITHDGEYAIAVAAIETSKKTSQILSH